MNSMMDDINKFAQIWDKAVESGVFGDMKPKEEPAPAQDDHGEDFFGNFNSDEYDIDRPINECDSKYWKELAKSAKERAPYSFDLTEEKEISKPAAKEMAKRLGSTFNPVYPNTMGKDQDLGTPVKVTQNWGVGGKELNDLEDLKKRLYELEVKLGSAGIIKAEKKKDRDESTILKSMADLKKQIDDLSDKLNGNRTDEATYSGDPKRMKAKYSGIDANGKPFKAGDMVTYFPRTKSIFSGQEGEKEYRDFLSAKGDEEGMPYAS